MFVNNVHADYWVLAAPESLTNNNTQGLMGVMIRTEMSGIDAECGTVFKNGCGMLYNRKNRYAECGIHPKTCGMRNSQKHH